MSVPEAHRGWESVRVPSPFREGLLRSAEVNKGEQSNISVQKGAGLDVVGRRQHRAVERGGGSFVSEYFCLCTL